MGSAVFETFTCGVVCVNIDVRPFQDLLVLNN